MSKRSHITEDEMNKINLLISLGLKNMEIAKLCDRSYNTICSIKSGYRERKLEIDRQYYRAKKQQQPVESQPVVEAKKEEVPAEKEVLRADGIEYTNALLNRLLEKMSALCEALGI